MAPSTQPALVLGGASLCATLAILIVGAQQPGCAFFDWTFPAILAVQIGFALAAGFATGYRRPHNREPLKAGLGTSLVAGLSGFIFFGVAATGLLPAVCSEGVNGIGLFYLVIILIFFIAPAAVAGTAAGWLGGLLARTNRGRIALACMVVAGLALGVLLLLLQPLGSGVRGITKVNFCPSDPRSACVLEPFQAQITVHPPHSEQIVAMVASDERGRYQIALAPGGYEISAWGRNGRAGPIAITISANRYLTLELDAK
jgi:hypothetical protein